VSELTPRTLQILGIMFSGASRQEMLVRLEQECSAVALGCRNWTPPQMERLWFAVIKLAHERPDLIPKTFALAKTDWRDLLMAAGFGHEPDAHEKWWTKNVT
jgi:hypothetical protein